MGSEDEGMLAQAKTGHGENPGKGGKRGKTDSRELHSDLHIHSMAYTSSTHSIMIIINNDNNNNK